MMMGMPQDEHGEHGVKHALAIIGHVEVMHDEQTDAVKRMVDDGRQQRHFQEFKESGLDRRQPLVENGGAGVD
jgi:hypothetical protein